MLIGVLLIGRNFNVHLIGGGLPSCGDPIHVSSSRSKDSISFIAKVSPSPFHISQIYFVSLTNLSYTQKEQIQFSFKILGCFCYLANAFKRICKILHGIVINCTQLNSNPINTTIVTVLPHLIYIYLLHTNNLHAIFFTGIHYKVRCSLRAAHQSV